MPIKTLLLPMTVAEPPEAASAMACRIAHTLGSLLTGYFVKSDPRAAIPFMGESLTADAIQQLCEAAEEEAKDMARTARETLGKRAKQMGLEEADRPRQGGTWTWEEVAGPLEDHVGRRARLADLTVLASPTQKADKDTDPDRSGLFNEVLFRSGRPMMVVPDKAPDRLPRSMLVAWNGRAEAARAMAAAVPLMRQAERVTIVTLGVQNPDRATAHQASAYLCHHGIDTDIVVDEADERSVGQGLLTKCKTHQADCLVMGAYSHSRWREIMLGGVTRHVVHHADIPLLLSH